MKTTKGRRLRAAQDMEALEAIAKALADFHAKEPS